MIIDALPASIWPPLPVTLYRGTIDFFDDPFTFNVLRDPNLHLGFGGTGAHYCIGANLARMTVDLMFNAIADQLPDLTPVAPPERLRSSMINGIKHWQVDYR